MEYPSFYYACFALFDLLPVKEEYRRERSDTVDCFLSDHASTVEY